MAFTHRQSIAYKHTVDLWQPTRTINATTGAPSDESYTLAYSGVKCLWDYTNNYSDVPTAAGRVKRPNLMTTDSIHFESSQQVEEGWIIVNRTLLPDGSQSQLYNDVSRILGSANFAESSGNRRANKKVMYATTLEKAPSTILSHYA
jgi:hypothetical protein